MTNTTIDSNEEYIPPVKLKKTTNEEDPNDLYCFECHDEGDVICCDSCPRVYHSKCLGLMTLPEGDWTCPECKISQVRCQINELPILLKYALRRMKSHPQATPFMRPVDPEQMPEYLDYIIYPMDLETIEKNIDLKKYSSTGAFLSDVKWITHNSVVFNGSQSKFTGIARAILKIARHEMTEIDICSECYLHSAQPSTPDWFAEPCTIPHTLCWAKMKGYQPWPAKVLRIVNDEVDVRFFGQHDRAWVPISNCFVLSKEYPGVEKKKSNMNFEKSLSELQIHIDRLKALHGSFTYAPLQTPLSKTKPFKFVSIIDDSILPTYVTVVNNNNSNALRSTIKCSKQAPSPLPQQSTKRSNENCQEQQDSVKRVRLSSRISDDNNTNTNRIVLRIRKPSEDLTTNRNESLNNSNNQITIQIKDPLEIVREDEEEEEEEEHESESDSQLSSVFDSLEQTSVPSPKDNEIPALSPKHSSPEPSPPVENQIEPSVAVKEEPEETIIVIDSDTISAMDALLDAVESLERVSKVQTTASRPVPSSSLNETRPIPLQFAERRSTVKQPRKSHLQQRIITSQQPPSKSLPINPTPLPPLDPHLSEQSFSPILPSIPLRPLSISPASVDNYEEASSMPNNDLLTQYKQLERSSSFETLSVKSEPMDTDESQKGRLIQLPTSTSSSSLATKSFLISPPPNPHPNKAKTSISSSSSSTTTTTTIPANTHFSAIIPNSNNNKNNNNFAPRIPSTVPPQKTNWPAHLSKPMPTAQKRPGPPVIYPPTAQRNNNSNPPTMRMNPSTSLQPQSFDAFSINPPIAQRRPNGVSHISNTQPIPNRNPIRMPQFNTPPPRISIEDHQTPAEIQMIIKNFNDKFQKLLTDFTVKIETALESNRITYEKELEETRRTYRQSMNELRTITTQQVQEMHNSLDLQYWTRLSEMRNRYESTFYKPSKHFNGTPH